MISRRNIGKTDDKEVTEAEKTIDGVCKTHDHNQKIMENEVIEANNC